MENEVPPQVLRLLWRAMYKNYIRDHGSHNLNSVTKNMWILGRALGVDDEDMHGIKVVCEFSPPCVL